MSIQRSNNNSSSVNHTSHLTLSNLEAIGKLSTTTSIALLQRRHSVTWRWRHFRHPKTIGLQGCKNASVHKQFWLFSANSITKQCLDSKQSLNQMLRHSVPSLTKKFLTTIKILGDLLVHMRIVAKFHHIQN